MASITVYTDKAEINHADVEYTVTDGGVLAVREAGVTTVVYSPSGWRWIEVWGPEGRDG